ncbi:MAG TPA: hypothetical protein VKU19_16785 [Bryobacteraceae bacterium]|nr:hypothetical protein [Bryobacteraceae bacterium]
MGDNFDIQFGLLPPKLQMQLWILALDANTSKVNLAYSSGNFRTGLAYNYGGNAEAFLSVRRFSVTAGVNPTNGNADLGLVYRGFRFGASGSVAQKSAGVNIGYGDSLLPFPAELSSTFRSGADGLGNMVRDAGSLPGNPLAWFGLHSNDATTFSKAVILGQQIAKSTNSTGLGVGLRLNFSEQTGLTIYGAAQLRFW